MVHTTLPLASGESATDSISIPINLIKTLEPSLVKTDDNTKCSTSSPEPEPEPSSSECSPCLSLSLDGSSPDCPSPVSGEVEKISWDDSNPICFGIFTDDDGIAACSETSTPSEAKSSSPLPPQPHVESKMQLEHSAKLGKTTLGKPKIVGYFSCVIDHDGNINYKEDVSSLRFLHIPSNQTVSVNLNEGYSEKGELACPDSDLILRYISENYFAIDRHLSDDDNDDDDDDAAAAAADDDDDDDDDDGDGDDDEADGDKEKPIADVICTSEVLSLIMTLAGRKSEEVTLIGVKVRGIIVLKLKEVTTNSKEIYQERKFLLGVTRRLDNSRKHPDGIDLFYTVNGIKIGDHQLLYSFPISAAANEETISNVLNERQFYLTILRSHKWSMDSKSKKNYLVKNGLNLWCSTFIGKCHKILYGIKEPGNWVKELELFKPEEIIKQARGWSPQYCVSLANQLLCFIKTSIKQDGTVFEVKVMPTTGQVEIRSIDDQPVNHIPSWYWKNQCYGDK